MVQEDVRRPYVDFAYYKNDYGGTQIKTENDFKRAESISEAFVNQVTFGRIARMSSVIDSIKDAMQYYGTADTRPYDANRGAHWFERMKVAEKEDILRGADKI